VVENNNLLHATVIYALVNPDHTRILHLVWEKVQQWCWGVVKSLVICLAFSAQDLHVMDRQISGYSPHYLHVSYSRYGHYMHVLTAIATCVEVRVKTFVGPLRDSFHVVFCNTIEKTFKVRLQSDMHTNEHAKASYTILYLYLHTPILI